MQKYNQQLLKKKKKQQKKTKVLMAETKKLKRIKANTSKVEQKSDRKYCGEKNKPSSAKQKRWRDEPAKH